MKRGGRPRTFSLSIRPSYGARGEEILDFFFRFHFSPFPQKRLILRLPHFENRSAGPVNKTINLGGVGILVAGGEAHVKLSHVGRLVQGEKTVKKILNEV